MKRKNINVGAADISEEGTSNDDEEGTDQDSEMEVGKESPVDSDESEGNGLDASATDSDEDESDVDSDAEDNSEQIESKKSKIQKVKEKILQRYQERHGKQLYIRFPHKVPETQEALEEKVRELTPLVVKVHKPRQRHARFCLVDFATKDDRDTALNNLKKSIKKGDLGKYVVNTPRTESADFVQELTERKIKSIENNKVKQRLKKASKKSLIENNFTSTVIVLNLPKTTSVLQVRDLFANAVDINIKPGRGKFNKDKSIAAITFPTTFDARNAIKKKLSLGGSELVIKFDNKMLKKKPNKNSKNISKSDELSQETKPVIKKQKLESITKSNESSRETKPVIKKQKLESITKNATADKSNTFVHKQNLNKNKAKKNTGKSKPK